MLILTLVGTLAAGMVWQQWRALQVEGAERARVQAAWILTGALDFGRVILRLDGRTPGVDHLGEPWATELQESSLSSLLAADRNNSADAGGPEVFLRGSIRDAQARYNLRNLIDNERKLVPAEVEALARLCDAAGLPPETASAIAAGLQAALAAQTGEVTSAAPLLPRSLAELSWLGLDAEAVAALEPLVTLLPEPSPLNLNTASAPVLAAVFTGLDAGSAQRLVQARQSRPFRTLAEAQAQIPGAAAFDSRRASVGSSYFVVSGRLRAEARQVEEQMLVVRRGREIVPLWRARRVLAPGAT